MSAKEHSKAYFNDLFLGETVASEYGPGSERVGYKGPVTGNDWRSWLHEVNLFTGGAWRQARANNAGTVYDTVYSAHPTVNALFAAAGKDLRGHMVDAFLASVRTAERVHQQGLSVGFGADGKNLVPCLAMSAAFVHVRNRNQEANLHGHVVKSQAGATEDGRTGRIRDTRGFFYNDALAQHVFQVSFAVELQRRAGIETTMVNGRAVVPGVPHEVAARFGSRRQEADAWCRDNGFVDRNGRPTPSQLAIGVRETALRRVPFDRDSSYGRWKQEADSAFSGWKRAAGQTGPGGMEERCRMKPGQGVNAWLKDHLDAYLVKPWQVILEGVKAPFRKDPQTVTVRNIDVLLYEVSKRPVIEGHRAALQAVRWGTFSSINEALKEAERAYKECRRQKRFLERGAKVTIDKLAAPTPEQMEKLERLAQKKGWTVEYEKREHQAAQQGLRSWLAKEKEQRQGQGMSQGG